MADEVTPLISFFNASKNVVALSHFTRCRSSCVQSKGAIVAIVWSVLLVAALGTTVILSNQFPTIFNLPPVTYVIMVVLYLIVPALGLLGEKWTRYNVLMFGSVTMSISYTLVLGLIMLNQFIDIGSTILPIVLVIAFCPYFFGLMLFIANIIQFGTDQLPFGSSEQLRSFIYCNVWPYYLTSTIILFILSVVTTLVVQNVNLYITSFLFGSTLIAIGVGFLSVCCFKHHLIIEPAQHNNPVKLIWRVVRYALKNKEPVKPSAFTYGESPPSRLDLAKERYGGPFTTGQVEDVKSFLYILSVLLTSYGISFINISSNLSNQYLTVLNLGGNRTATFTERMILQFPLTIPFFVFAMYILTSQLLIFPFFSRFIPRMLKRIWIGLVGILLQLAITTVIAYILNKDITRSFDNVVCLEMTGHNTSYYDAGMEIFTLPYLVMILPQFLSGISSIVVTVTGFEFILAQGPRNMQGLLIGLWLVEGNVFFYINTSFCYWEYYAVITSLALISVIVYTIAAYKYKYRQRNELSDVNERIIITEYTERQLLQKYNVRLEDQQYYEVDSMIMN